MRNTDEQLSLIMQRADRLKARRTLKNRVIADSVSALVCLALLIGAASALPRFTNADSADSAWRYGSLILSSPYLGYVVIGILALALGVSATLLCLHIKKLRTEDREKK